MSTRYASRKFLLSLLALVGGVLALWIDKMSGSSFVALVGVILTGYGAANVVEKIKHVDTDVQQERQS